MPELSAADRFLLDRVRQGDGEAWRQMVEQYQGRLVAFARTRSPDPGGAEDLVQDTFIAFLQSLRRFRGDAAVETYLFTILRRRLIDQLRGRRLPGSLGDETARGLPARDPSPSWYMRREEGVSEASERLVAALRELVGAMQASLRFDDLLVLELIFTSDLRSKEISEKAGIPNARVRVVKHRTIKRLHEFLVKANDSAEEVTQMQADDAALATLWRDYRLGCPKRSTIGGYLLETLDTPWQAYTHAHLGIAACPTCQANLTDLQSQAAQADQSVLRERILNSTVGFFPQRPS